MEELQAAPGFRHQAADPEKGIAIESQRIKTPEDQNASDTLSPVSAYSNLLVTWDGPDDPTNPKNWSYWCKWTTTVLTSFGGLVTLMSGAMMAPALNDISADLDASETEVQMALSIFVLAFAFGPLVIGPCSEVFGRKPVWLLCFSWYVVWNLVCGFVHTKGLMVAARFLAGLGASAHFAVVIPILADCWSPAERGRSMALSTFISLLGPAIGAILGGYVTERAGWRWLFWVLSISGAVLVVLVAIVFRETYAPKILAQKARKLSRSTGANYYTSEKGHTTTLRQRLVTSLARPFRLLGTQPIIQVMSLYLAYNFGILYIVLSTFATLWIDRYHESVGTSGLNYIALVIGYTIASQVGGPVTDRIWRHLQHKNGGRTAPEYRVPLMVPGAIMVPIGLFWYGWAAEHRLHWAITDAGIGVFGCGSILSTQAGQAYVMDAFKEHTASATAASQFLRNIFAFVFPIFTPQMYKTLGYGWGNSLLAFLSLAIGLPAPLILWEFGARLRNKAKIPS